MFPEDSLCIVGNARVQNDNPIIHRYAGFFIIFVVSRESGEILESEASFALGLTKRFVAEFFRGRSLAEMDESLVESLKARYFGSSLKAIVVAYRDGVKKYQNYRAGILPDE